jgi:hypothetical protein
VNTTREVWKEWLERRIRETVYRPNADEEKRDRWFFEAGFQFAESTSGLKDARHASAPEGYKCSDCTIDSEACPLCYARWWEREHPNVLQITVSPTKVDLIDCIKTILRWCDRGGEEPEGQCLHEIENVCRKLLPLHNWNEKVIKANEDPPARLGRK